MYYKCILIDLINTIWGCYIEDIHNEYLKMTIPKISDNTKTKKIIAM